MKNATWHSVLNVRSHWINEKSVVVKHQYKDNLTRYFLPVFGCLCCLTNGTNSSCQPLWTRYCALESAGSCLGANSSHFCPFPVKTSKPSKVYYYFLDPAYVCCSQSQRPRQHAHKFVITIVLNNQQRIRRKQ